MKVAFAALTLEVFSNLAFFVPLLFVNLLRFTIQGMGYSNLAVTAGVLAGLCTEPRLASLRQALGLNEQSRVLLISTEGDTDRENYRRILCAE